ncbi:FecR family protein [Pedobacter gandavensis]|uniref:FecR family protein n=1 Tax=Pedobacter TaxID=84567 RepID=UPI001C99DEE3|nr:MULTISPECIES: FecR family protein [Pedobacter]WGQ10073.1 FecR family protein [Pedobacter gandavensis]
MSIENKEAVALLKKYKERNCSPEELAMLESWYLSYGDGICDLDVEALKEAKSAVWARLPIHTAQPKTLRLWPAIAVAAAVVLVMGLGIMFFKNYQASNAIARLQQEEASIRPGGPKAMLTLADGSKISLEEAANGKLASQAGITITKTKDGQLVYTMSPSTAETPALKTYNTISTPKGGQYQINLPDGTRVWLNAASSLKYPIDFGDQERKVELTGEGYFEVSPDKERPFKVNTARQMVSVLGTHFNISSYEDDGFVKTTLLEGKVKVQLKDLDVSALLSPGEQSVLKDRTFNVQKVDVEEAIAWKNNTFVFHNEELGDIMREISRWYDVEVVCPDEMAKVTFSGTISRSKNIKQTLRTMLLTGTVHFKFEGRRITVMP